MAKSNPYLERKVRIEVLRARAAVERGQLCKVASELSHSLEPSTLFNVVRSQLTHGLSSGLGAGMGSWVDLIFSSGRRYPLLFSGASALLSSVLGKKKWRLGAMALTAWRLFGAYQHLHAKKQERYIQPRSRPKSTGIGPF